MTGTVAAPERRHINLAILIQERSGGGVERAGFSGIHHIASRSRVSRLLRQSRPAGAERRHDGRASLGVAMTSSEQSK